VVIVAIRVAGPLGAVMVAACSKVTEPRLGVADVKREGPVFLA
jgi:hypothetical protein